MTLNKIYRLGKQLLKDAKIQSYSFDANQILKKVFGFDRTTLILEGDKSVSDIKANEFIKFIKKRASGYPLQYILECWEFMGLEFEVGEGVLIPRDDTEVLVTESEKIINKLNRSCKIVDLCSGSGIIAVSMGKRTQNCTVYAVEHSKTAYNFLEKNIKKHEMKNVIPVLDDVLSLDCVKKFRDLDVIISNPPYIPSKDIQYLQKEVQIEPHMALDGGTDGLQFYKFFADYWINNLKPGGYICVEVGIHQSQEVKKIFDSCDKIETTFVYEDINRIPRVVIGKTFD